LGGYRCRLRPLNRESHGVRRGERQLLKIDETKTPEKTKIFRGAIWSSAFAEGFFARKDFCW
jgi:hypothetical protein